MCHISTLVRQSIWCSEQTSWKPDQIAVSRSMSCSCNSSQKSSSVNFSAFKTWISVLCLPSWTGIYWTKCFDRRYCCLLDWLSTLKKLGVPKRFDDAYSFNFCSDIKSFNVRVYFDAFKVIKSRKNCCLWSWFTDWSRSWRGPGTLESCTALSWYLLLNSSRVLGPQPVI